MQIAQQRMFYYNQRKVEGAALMISINFNTNSFSLLNECYFLFNIKQQPFFKYIHMPHQAIFIATIFMKDLIYLIFNPSSLKSLSIIKSKASLCELGLIQSLLIITLSLSLVSFSSPTLKLGSILAPGRADYSEMEQKKNIFARRDKQNMVLARRK
ncbi:hypothetical protein FGO68_gene3090 [Halteria grandinella]|uniref:Transmembrane protein n=1 Tax=Halteria grandinella TaxID=5974 RepID=A0A8J8P148_HALGN|nr:hypothetical protein FGO68_gene3090 [Halteria grandinella]